MSVATFGPASLQAQLAELKRERSMRLKVYPHLVASGKLDRSTADYQMRGLDGAIATLERLVSAELRGEPARKELVDILRDIQRLTTVDELPGMRDRLDALLARIPA